MAQHEYRGELDSRSQRTRSKLRAVQAIDLAHHLPSWLDVAYTVYRVEQAARWERLDYVERGWPVPPPEPWGAFLRRCWVSYRRRLADRKP